MKLAKILLFVFLSFIMVFPLLLTGCTDKKDSLIPSPEDWGNPVYGGTLTIRVGGDPQITGSWDTFGNGTGPWLETLGTRDWTVDREVCGFNTSYIPRDYRTGLLAENWEIEDSRIFTFHIRQGVHFQDIPPVNGREMNAYDIEYSYNRAFGLGDFTEASPFKSAGFNYLESVTATDDYTVVFEFSQPSLDHFDTLIDYGSLPAYIIPREAVEEWGDLSDWHHQIGTGPFIVEDFVSGSSVTLSRNPNYWNYDVRYPENKLPYVDELKYLVIPDQATAQAALRTGQIDLFSGHVNASWLSWEQAEKLSSTNPDLVQTSRPNNANVVDIRFGAEPFYQDIRVRQALQMAIDLPTIAESYYKGTVASTPYGLLGPAFKDVITPFEDWPKDVKETYTYSPEKARQLLAEAGYPEGFDVKCVADTTADLSLLQIVQSQLSEIGVGMEIETMDKATFTSVASSGNYESLAFGYASHACNDPVNRVLNRRTSNGSFNYPGVADPVFDQLCNEYYASMDPDEKVGILRDIDDYAISQHWVLVLLPDNLFNINQPWLKGYSGEIMIDQLFSHMWIDQELKESMGY